MNKSKQSTDKGKHSAEKPFLRISKCSAMVEVQIVTLKEVGSSPLCCIWFWFICRKMLRVRTENSRNVIVGKILCVRMENRRKISLKTIGLRNITSSSSELLGLIRSACQKSVPSPWYLSTASSCQAGGVFRQLFLQCRSRKCIMSLIDEDGERR